MNNEFEDDKMLDDALKRAVGTGNAQFDAAAWMDSHREEVEMLKCRSTAPVDGTQTSESENLLSKGYDRPKGSIYTRIMNNRKFRILAPATVAAAIVIMVMVFTIGGNPKIALADALKQLQGKSYEFTVTNPQTGDNKNNLKVMVMEPGKMRIMPPDDSSMVYVLDIKSKKAIGLDPARKLALRYDKPEQQKEVAEMMDMILGQSIGDLWSLQTGSEIPLGSRAINGHQAVGFQVKSRGDDYDKTIDVWADEKTAAPVRVNIVMKLNHPNSKLTPTHEVELSDFKAIEKPDPSLFSTDMPEGYMPGNYLTLQQLSDDPTLKTVSPQGAKILKAIGSMQEGDKAKAIEALLAIDWGQEIRFDLENYLLALSEKQFVSLVDGDQSKVNLEMGKQGEDARAILFELRDRARNAQAAKDYEQAEKLLAGMDNFGRYFSRKEATKLSRTLGIAFQMLAAQERVGLRQALGDPEKLKEAEQRLKDVKEESERLNEEFNPRPSRVKAAPRTEPARYRFQSESERQ